MAFDFRKEYKELYLPGNQPMLVRVPMMRCLAVRGQGDPNEADGAYQQAIQVLYALAYTLKMSLRAGHKIDGFSDYVVPPLEGFWQQDSAAFDPAHKEDFRWISVIRLPDFVTQADFDWAVNAAAKKKKLDCSGAEYLMLEEGLCVQMMHIGAFDNEPETVQQMDAFLAENGFVNDFSSTRWHHEIYLSDPRRVPVEKWKTVIRHPVKKK